MALISIASSAESDAPLETNASAYGVSTAVALAPLVPIRIPPDDARADAVAPVPFAATLSSVSVL